MKNKILKTGLFFAIFSLQLQSQIICDTLLNIEAADGVNHIRCKINSRHIVNLLSIDLKNPDLYFEAHRADSLQKITTQFISKEEKGSKVVAAINGDYFSFQNGFPLNVHVQKSVPVFLPEVYATQLIFSDKQKPYFDSLQINIYGITSRDTFTIDGVNRILNTTTTKLYNKFGSLHKIPKSSRVYLKQINKTEFLNDTVIFLNSAHNDFDYILAFAENSKLNDNLKTSDTLKIVFEIKNNIEKITDIISGRGHLIKNNLYQPDNLSQVFRETEHPRTFVGFNSDTTNFYFLVVDGRQTSSTGMSFQTMIEVLRFWKITNALNLDGGGSTTMVVHNKIVNSPSDVTGERAVANSLQLLSKAPLTKFIQERKNYIQQFDK